MKIACENEIYNKISDQTKESEDYGCHTSVENTIGSDIGKDLGHRSSKTFCRVCVFVTVVRCSEQPEIQYYKPNIKVFHQW